MKFINLLIRLARKGIEVSIILDFKEDEMSIGKKNSIVYRILKKSKGHIKVAYNDQKCLMHCKFWVIDGKKLGIGSTNWTYQAFHRNFENVSLINSKK